MAARVDRGGRRRGRDIATLTRCLKSVVAAASAIADRETCSTDIVVVDDHSPVPLEAQLPQEIAQQVSIIKNLGTPGHGGALNYAISTLDHDCFCFTDPECVIADDWLALIADWYVGSDSAGLAGPNWLFLDQRSAYSRWLTRNESALTKYLFVRRLLRTDHEAHTNRIDLRNFAARRMFFERTNFAKKHITASSGIMSFGSMQIKGELREIGGISFSEELHTYRAPIRSLLAQARIYYSRARSAEVLDIYTSGGTRTIWRSFSSRFAKLHFDTPTRHGVSAAYVYTVHGAFWLGLLRTYLARKATSRRPRGAPK